MPLPIPSADESEQDFVSRFMGDEQAVSDFPDESQRSAVAYSTYRDDEMDEMELGGVSILEVGEAKGHDLFVDKTSLETALKLMQEAKNGTKAKMNHGSGLEAVVGFLRNPRIDGDKLVADLRLLRNSPHYGLIKEMASEAPDQFGVSLAFVNESETINGKDYIRPQSIASADLVSSPAATNGLFEEMVKFMEKLGYVQGGKSIPAMKKEEMAEEAPKIVIEKEDEDKKEEKTEEMSEVVKKVLTEFGIKPIPASPSIEVPSEKKEEPKTFEALVAAHSDYGTSKLKAMKAVMLSNPKEYSEALTRGISKL
jgi:hypothetical protein